MILDFKGSSTPTEFNVDVCIVGAGAAGYALARELKASGKSVLVVAGGDNAIRAAEQSLYEAEVAALPYKGHVDGRFRADGGSTTRWGGQMLPLEPQDFLSRDWVPMSGWPFDVEFLAPYYKRAIDLMDAGVLEFGDEALRQIGTPPPAFDPSRFTVRFSHWVRSNRRNFAAFLRGEFKGTSVTILRNGHVARFVTERERVLRAELVAFGGKTGRIEAENFVLASGGIENPRILLASEIGGDMVGRCYQDHLSFPLGTFAREDTAKVRAWFQPIYLDGILRTAKIAMTFDAQQAHRTLNAMTLISFPYPESSAPMAARRMILGLKGRPRKLPNPKDLLQAFAGIPDLGTVAYNRLVRKRRAVPQRGDAVIIINMEQAPNLDSRIELSEERDALGIPRAKISWRLTDLEQHTMKTYVELFDAEWKRIGGQPIQWEPYAWGKDEAYLTVLEDIYHHIGGTRISSSPEEGVVDADLRVHGVENLYVAGSSVFPTGGSSNPTLTLLALTMRLADRLR